MAFPTILTLGLLASSISVITCRFASHASEVDIAPAESQTIVTPDENGTIVVPGGNFLPTGSITEMTYRGKVIVKKFTCPAIYGRYPHPESCEYYFECRFGWPTLWHCNRGYLYDSKQEKCLDKRRVKCHIGHERDRDRDHNHHRDGKDKDIEVKEDVRDFKCPYIWGTFAHPYDCSKYYICVYNYPKLFQCYQNFLYDAHYRKCLPRNKVKCGDRLDRDQMRTSRRPPTLATTVKPEEITTVNPKKSKFYCPFPYGRYPDPEDCTRFYECRFSIPHLYTCPESTLYDERKEQCLDKKTVKCGGRPGGNDEGVDSVDDKNVSFRCPYVWGTFAHPVDCSKYIICIYNVPSNFNCRKNELFDAHYRRCLPKERVSCDGRINPDNPHPSENTTTSSIFSTSSPSTIRKLPEPTISQKPDERTTTSTTTTFVPTTISTTSAPTTVTTITPSTTVTIPVTATSPSTTTSAPATVTATPSTTETIPATTTRPSTTTSTSTTITTITPSTTATIPVTTTSSSTTTSAPTTISTITPSTTAARTTLITTITTPEPTTASMPTTPDTTQTASPNTPARPAVSSEATTIEKFSTILPTTKPNTPPPTECDEDDLDCIIDGTGDVSGWFDCPKRYGHFPHGSSQQLFIHCDNWRPFIKKCAEHTRFSPTFLVCVWENKKQTK